VLDRKPSSSYPAPALPNGQVAQPFSNYGLEFQDLRLPISVKVADASLHIIGAYGLPDLEGARQMTVVLPPANKAARLVLVSNVLDSRLLQTGQTIVEFLLEDTSGKTLTIPLRMDTETTSWDKPCAVTAPCQTVFQWRKRMAMVSQNGYPGALREFSAGLHGVVLELPAPQQVAKVTVRYTADSGQFYLWALALSGN